MYEHVFKISFGKKTLEKGGANETGDCSRGQSSKDKTLSLSTYSEAISERLNRKICRPMISDFEQKCSVETVASTSFKAQSSGVSHDYRSPSRKRRHLTYAVAYAKSWNRAAIFCGKEILRIYRFLCKFLADETTPRLTASLYNYMPAWGVIISSCASWTHQRNSISSVNVRAFLHRDNENDKTITHRWLQIAPEGRRLTFNSDWEVLWDSRQTWPRLVAEKIGFLLHRNQLVWAHYG